MLHLKKLCYIFLKQMSSVLKSKTNLVGDGESKISLVDPYERKFGDPLDVSISFLIRVASPHVQKKGCLKRKKEQEEMEETQSEID